MVLVSNGTDIVNGLNYIADFGTNSFSVTNLTASSATITNLIATSGSITNLVSSDASATVLRAGSATLTHLSATSASITNLALTSLTISSLSITNVSVASVTVSSVATFAAGSAAAPSITTTGDTNTGIFFPAADTIAFTEGGVESMRIDSSGNVGIGTASPANYANYRNLAISGTTGGNIDMLSGSTKVGNLFNDGTNFYAYNAIAGSLVFGTNNTERARIDSSGNLGIGTSSPSNKLEVNGTVAINGIGFNANAINTTSTSARTIRLTSTGGDFYVGTESSTGGAVFPGSTAYAAVLYNAAVTPMQFWTGGTLRMTLDTSGNLGIGTSSPITKLDVRSDAAVVATSGYSSLHFNALPASATARAATIRKNYDSPFDFNIYASTGTSGNSAATIFYRDITNESMRLDSSGNLGIGTSSPSGRLDVVGGLLGVGNGTIKTVISYATEGIVGTTSNHALLLYANNAERARITSGGNFGIGTTAPVNKLSVIGLISASDSNFTASAYIHASPDSGANRNIGQFSVSGATNGLQVNWDHASSKMHIIINNIPTSSAGLPGGTLYSDGGTIKIA
jgi:hypothetical protein